MDKKVLLKFFIAVGVIVAASAVTFAWQRDRAVQVSVAEEAAGAPRTRVVTHIQRR